MKPVPLFTPLAPREELGIRSASRTAVGEFAFDLILSADPSAQLSGPELTFPGFVPTRPPHALPDGGWRFTGRIERPGFYPLTVTARHDQRRVTGRDYFLVAEPTPAPPGPTAGYYVFLGCGDYPIITGRETHPAANWTLAQWQDLVVWMGRHGMNRLWVLVNGYTLAYPSQRYPELRDRYARNVSENFLGELIDFGHAHGVATHLMFTTDGHARAFSQLHPEAVRLDAQGQPGPQYGLALEHPMTRRYLFDVLDEVLALYPRADGVAVHPTESDPDRFNPESVGAYREETGRDLGQEPADVRRAWHNRAFARFMHEWVARCRRAHPHLEVTMANCWWQDDFVALNHAALPADLRIAVWHYAWEETAAKPWSIHSWVKFFDPNRLIYVPTSQSYLYPTDATQVMDRHLGTDRLVSTAAALGVRDTVYFAGWDFPVAEGRLADALLVRHPTTSRLRTPADRLALIPQLYDDYFAARARALASI